MNQNQNDPLQRRKAAIAAFLQSNSGGGADRIAARPTQQPCALSFGQERLWLLDRMGAGAAYNVAVSLHLDGMLDRAAFEASLAALVERHQVLRTTYREAPEGVRQEVEAAAFAPRHTDASALPALERDALVRDLARR